MYPINEVAAAVASRNFDSVRHLLAVKKEDVNAVDVRGDTPLHIAVQHGLLDIVKILLKFGANVYAVDDEEQTPIYLSIRLNDLHITKELAQCMNPIYLATNALHFATYCGRSEIVDMLLHAGVNVNATDVEYENRTALHIAVTGIQNCRTTQVLLRHSANVNAVMAAPNSTPLLVAVRAGSVDNVKLLLRHNADINYPDEFNNWQTALHLAVRKGSCAIAKLLLSKNAYVNAQNTAGDTPLHMAVIRNNEEMVDILLDAKANVNLMNDEQQSPLIFAAYKEKRNIVNKLIKAGADLSDIKGYRMSIEENTHKYKSSTNYKQKRQRFEEDEHPVVQNLTIEHIHGGSTYFGYPATLHMSAMHGDEHMVQELLNNGHDVNELDPFKGETALHTATFASQRNIVELLLAHKADINARDRQNETPLQVAVAMGDSEMVRFLLKMGAQVNVVQPSNRIAFRLATHTDTEICSPEPPTEITYFSESLYRAAASGNARLVRDLLADGAVVNAQNVCWEKETALHAAAAGGKMDIIKMLLMYGADRELRNGRNQTPFDVAKQCKKVNAMRLIEVWKTEPDI